MMKKKLKVTIYSFGALCLIMLNTYSIALAQNIPQAGPKGHLYGKVVDENGKGVGYATVQLFKITDSTDKQQPTELVTGQITEDNGDFSLENISTKGMYILKVSFIGYAEVEKTVGFDMPKNIGGDAKTASRPGAGFPGAGAGLEKDLGNIKLVSTAQSLETVVVSGEKSTVTLAIDKKVYRVDKDASTAGGNAVDALKNVPSLSVDIDGNVALRNGAPQIFVDGRPTTLTLDQIAADAIETVEVITNPSAKYDAGGSTAGIVNIVLKKEKRLGYNGNIRLGTDTRGGFNLGGDINAGSPQTNLFLSGNLNQRKGYSNGVTNQQYLNGDPRINSSQILNNSIQGAFANIRGGMDWFVDNRNTLTFSGNYTHGRFNPYDILDISVDSLFESGIVSNSYTRTADENRNFKNLGGAVQFKHIFPKQGSEWTADLNYNQVQFLGGSDYETMFSDHFSEFERQDHQGNGRFVTFQSDLINQISPSIKLETGVRAALRRNTSNNLNQFLVDGNWIDIDRISDHYKFSDDVYAAYASVSHEYDNWGYQVGLRGESSFYEGVLTGIDSSFNINYPVSLFPSLFLTRKLRGGDNLQFSYTRRINRPNFFQTMPFTDISNSLNPRRGNPQLRPEFTNSLELSYQKLFAQKHNLLFSLYYKQATDLITAYLTETYVEELGEDLLITTFTNSNKSYAYGGELTLKNSLFEKIDLTSNFNIYQSRLDASNVESSLAIDRISWFLKEQLSIRLPQGFTVQLSGEYRSKASFTPGTDSRMPWMPQATNTAQGYTLANWFIDAAIRKDLMNRKASLTLNINDIFRSRKFGTFTSSDLFIQDSYRVRDSQVLRLNFSYRFGKADASLFRRKNMNQTSQGNDMMN